jgi:hypothetical protein
MEDLNSMVIVIFGRPAWFELMFENAMLTHSHKVSGCLASAHIVPWKQSWKGNRRTYIVEITHRLRVEHQLDSLLGMQGKP